MNCVKNIECRSTGIIPRITLTLSEIRSIRSQLSADCTLIIDHVNIESWIPVMKGAFEGSDPDSDSSVKSPHLCREENLPPCISREVTYFQVDGISGLHFRHGNTRNSY